jgi:hypothetical protein
MLKASYSLLTGVTINNYMEEGENMQEEICHLRDLVIGGRIIEEILRLEITDMDSILWRRISSSGRILLKWL